MRKVLRYEVRVDDRAHRIPVGPVLGLNAPHPDVVEIWVEVETVPVPRQRYVQVFGTGHPLLSGATTPLGMAIWDDGAGRLVWHLYEMV